MGYKRFGQPLDVNSGAGAGAEDLRGLAAASLLFTAATSEGTLTPPGNYALESTSTGDGDGPVYTLAAPSSGDLVILAVKTNPTTSSQILVAAATGVTFDGTNDVLGLSSVGAAAVLVGESTSRYMLLADFGATLAATT